MGIRRGLLGVQKALVEVCMDMGTRHSRYAHLESRRAT